ncbi:MULTISPECIES: NADPH-dependent F420 reductase [Streptomycetaceae]|uniref:NADP oxidoreductase coenzyme F420-dependent n=1 Tax=Streptantibioticus cattleyicolor (strain ATCC 35852 / DSM 46488 / JCM 4925 / NBRC 14057 / NRRL 8057) TaxID=1003195 RepID=F8JVY0_STREN|nr:MULTISPECIES: NAD(P)-binding domain-containing protein [Streptomycetaceae]AEW92602.1 NADP oxidoreductase coenzyme F420-dependent [Streptantibioticus cattleyicolor NRRL 8057 = DSM 46488]MYS57383.1 NAD(P)-binding domain-containing protein [Streptomyces sp. SID5468]CCB72957.1 Predicted dinucleotide-binding enzyme [Streptantibioticus cattleyicolor NRRL 8057 = DSM 46488]
MRIGIIGAGNIGSALARRFARVGYEVLLSNSRGPQTLTGLVQEIGGPVRAVTAAEAAASGEAVVVSIPYGRHRELPAEPLRGKVVVDTCNYYPERDGHDPDLDEDTTTSSEKIKAHTEANLVKAFNTLPAATLRDGGRPKGDPGRLAIPVSGSDEEAKAVVAGLIRDIGFDAVDAGTLSQGGRKHQPGTKVYAQALNAAELDALLRAE